MTLPASLKSKFYIDGHFFPIKIFSSEEAAKVYQDYEKYVAKLGQEGDARSRPHLVAKWAQNIVTHPVLVSAVKTALGSNNVLCLQSELCVQPPASQSEAGWQLEPSDRVVTAWLALTPCNNALEESELSNLPGERRVMVELEAGEVSLHSWRSVLTCGPDRSDKEQVGLAITYCTDEVQNMKAVVVRERASLICGSGGMFWDLETPPARDYGVKELEQQRLSCERVRQNMQPGPEGEEENGEEKEEKE